MRLTTAVLALAFLALGCKKQQGLFVPVEPGESGILFSNDIAESNSLSVLNYEYIYNGGGVGIGDFNGDSLPDVYFTGSMVRNKLYINRGNFQFYDITAAAGVDGKGRWCKGVSVVDINQDGLSDIYVCAAVHSDPEKRKNLLYINKGVPKGKTHPEFEDRAEAYGLADASNTHMAAFFDYDNDGDLDVYLLLNDLDGTYPNEFRPIRKDGSWPNTDKLLENRFDSSLGHAYFTDVSAKAGITIEGHGLGLAVADVNQDGWKDVYVSNDYISNNILYINNGDGTFTDRCAEYLKHTSRNAMGNDIADINNDGLPDIVETDMAPADNYRLKMMYSDISYQTFQNSQRFGYVWQYPRNMLQVHNGYVKADSNPTLRPVFSEVAYWSGVAHTDWSWAPLLADADNDGKRDLFITNGLPRDMSDLDFIAYRRNAVASTPLEVALAQLPTVKVSNYAFRNTGDLRFENVTLPWGWQEPGFSAGMAYADLDADGDLDFVINNTNMPATILKNRARELKDAHNFLKVKLIGSGQNRSAFGAFITLYQPGGKQVYEYTPYRGYMSCVESLGHFGLGNELRIDSVVVQFQSGLCQTIRQVAANTTLLVYEKDGRPSNSKESLVDTAALFEEVSKETGLVHLHQEVDFIDFNIQKLIPHKLTQYGPAIAVGDLDGDAFDDVVIGGSSPFSATIYMQRRGGRFIKRPLVKGDALQYHDDGALCLFDADGDGDLDLFIASGGAENEPQAKAYTDHFYENDGRGNFTERQLPFLNNRASKGAVKACDYDKDGDQDLLIAGRVIPGSYPQAASSFLYRNDSKPGNIVFTDVTQSIASDLQRIGMVSDLLWSDLNNDGWVDMLLALEWGPIVCFSNKEGKFLKVQTNLERESGWWNALHAADLDDDGDMDYVAGNFGMNGFLQPTAQFPIRMYGADFDGNGSFDAVLSAYITDSSKAGRQEYPLASRDEFIKEMSVMKTRFPNYSSYARATIPNIFQPDFLEKGLRKEANNFYSCWVENLGNFQFRLHHLPVQAQWAPLYGLWVADTDDDGKQDVIVTGNEYGMSPSLGRYDALSGWVLLRSGDSSFTTLSPGESGIFVPGNGRALASCIVDGQLYLLASQNQGPLKAFRWKVQGAKWLNLEADDEYVLLKLKNGKVRRQEFMHGSGFMSQSSRKLMVNRHIASISLYNRNGLRKEIKDLNP